MNLKIKYPTEVDKIFLQRVIDHACIAKERYGNMRDAFPNKINAIESAKARIKKYLESDNKAYLIDAVVFLMAEHAYPSCLTCYYPTASSIGRVTTTGEITRDSNDQLLG